MNATDLTPAPMFNEMCEPTVRYSAPEIFSVPANVPVGDLCYPVPVDPTDAEFQGIPDLPYTPKGTEWKWESKYNAWRRVK